ncbi:MAG: helix-turn-helix transcriptional regulator [Thiogranum sp.]
MQLYNMDGTDTHLAVEHGRHLKKTSSAVFKLGDKLCLAVQEDSLDEFTAAEFTGAQQEAPNEEEQDRRNGPQIVGEFTVEGMRYLVLCRIPSESRASAAAPTAIADVLTPRELQIALLVAKGRLNKQIADQLKVSEWTVSSHLRRIYAKLGVHTRAAMVACVIRGDVHE